MKRLLVVIPDRITDIFVKGEYPPRYYNPGAFFEDVHLLLMNDDRPDPAGLRHIVGHGNVTVHNFTAASFDDTWGYRPRLLRKWAQQAVDIAAKVRPVVVRAYGHYTSTFAAAEIRRQLDIPLVVSLHGNPDVDYYRGRLARTWRQRLEGWLSRAYEVASLRQADMVLPVYSPIVPFLESIGVRRYKVVYNVVGLGMSPRTNYAIDPAHVRAVCVGRQTPCQKNPAAIIEAIAQVDGVYLDLVGAGPLHESLVEMARQLGLQHRVTFHQNMENERVLALMGECDLFVYQSDNYEISKGTMEAALTGLPVVLNERAGGLADEIRNGPFLVVQNSAAGYRSGLERIIADDALREDLGRRGADYARRMWQPHAMENEVVNVYRSLLA
jgi:glycosyltransferase involved in cell wall biosynthesis